MTTPGFNCKRNYVENWSNARETRNVSGGYTKGWGWGKWGKNYLLQLWKMWGMVHLPHRFGEHLTSLLF